MAESPITDPPVKKPASSYDAASNWLDNAGRKSSPYYGTGFLEPQFVSFEQTRKYIDQDYGYFQGADIEDFYAQRQGNLEKIGKGLLNLPLTAITKTFSGVGYIAGLANPMNWFADEGYFNAVADNGISKVFNDLEEGIKIDWMPQFQEASDRDKGFFSRAFTDLNFWTEDVVDGAAFMASAFVPGLAATKLGLGVKLAQGLSRTGMGLEAAAATVPGIEVSAANYLRGASNLAKNLDKATVVSLATASESMVEAKQIRDNVLRSLEGMDMSEEEKKKVAGTAARNGFLMNATLLGATNLLELNYFYKLLGKSDDVARGVIGGSAFGEAATVFEPTSKLGKFLTSNKGAFLKGAGLSVLREGFVEENMQLAIQRVNEEYGKAGKALSMKEFYKVFGQYKDQTLNAVFGPDTAESRETAMNIGLGGILGGVMGGAGNIAQARRDRDYSKQAVEALNEAQNSWLKFGNIYQTVTEQVTNDKGEVETKTKLKLDNSGNPVVDEKKLADVISDLKLNIDALSQARLATSPLEQRLLRNQAFASFVQAHINAGIGESIFQKLDSAKTITPEDLIKLGFDPDTKNLDNDIATYRKIAQDIIDQNKLIERDILFTGRESDQKRKKELLNLASRQAVSKVLASQLQNEADEIRNSFTTAENSSLTDSLVDQLNDLKIKILKQERKVDELISSGVARSADLSTNEKILKELQEKFNAVIEQNPEGMSSIKQDEEGFYKYEKAERNDPTFLNNYIRKISHKADFENNIRALGIEFGLYADAIKGSENFENGELELSKKIEDSITKDEEEIIDPNAPGTVVTWTDQNGVEQSMEFKPGQTFVGRLTQIEKFTQKFRGLGKGTVTQFNNDRVKIIAISEDGNTITITINGDAAIDVDAKELAQVAKDENWRDYNSLSDIQKAYLALRNKIIRYRVISRDANGKYIKGSNGKYATEVVSGRVSLGGKNRNELNFKFVNPRTGKQVTVPFEQKYVIDKSDITGLPTAEQMALNLESERISKNYETQAQYFTELIQETEAGLQQAENRRKANASEYARISTELEGFKKQLEDVLSDLQTTPYVRGRKSSARKNLERLQAELPNKITEHENLLKSLEQEKQDLQKLLETLSTSRDVYYNALDEIEQTGLPFDRGANKNLGDNIASELDELEKEQLTKRFDQGQLDKMISQTTEEIEQIDQQVGLLQNIINNAKTLLRKIMSYKELYDTLDDPNLDDNLLRFRLVQLKKELQNRIQQKRQEIIDAGGDPDTTVILGDTTLQEDQDKLRLLNAFIESNNKGLGIGAAYTRKLIADVRESTEEIDRLTAKRDNLAAKLIRLETAIQQKEYISSLKERLDFLNQIQEGLTSKYAKAKERAEQQQKINAAQASIRAGLADGFIDDSFNDSEEADNELASPFEDPQPVFEITGLMKTFGRHLTPERQYNSENANDRFYKFTDSNPIKSLFLMPVTASNDTFGIRREDQFKDDIKLVVVKKVGDEYKYVGMDGQVLETPTKDNIVYTSMGGNATLLGDDKVAAVKEVTDRFAVKSLKPSEVLAELNKFIAFRNQVKDRIAKGETVYLPVVDKSRGVQARLPKDDVTGRPQEHNLVDRLLAEDTQDWTNPKHPDGTSISLEVATTKRVQNTSIPLGRPVIVKDNTVFRVYNSDLTTDQKNTVIEALKVLSKLFPRKSDPKNPLNQDEERDFNDIIRYLSGVVYWSLPDSKDTVESAFNSKRLYVYTDPNTGSITLFRGTEGYVFNEEQIEANREKIVNGLKHNVSNPLLSGKRKAEPFYDLSIKDGKVTRAKKYTNYQHYMLEPREDGSSPIYTNIPLYTGKEGFETQMNSVYLIFGSDIKEPGAPVSNPIAAKKEFVASSKRSLSEMQDGKYRMTAETARGVKFTVTFNVQNGSIQSDYTTQATQPDGSPYDNLDALNKVVNAITESIAEGTLPQLISESNYKSFDIFEETAVAAVQPQAPIVSTPLSVPAEPAPVAPATTQPEINDSALASILEKYSKPQFDEDTNYRIAVKDFVETEDFTKLDQFMQKSLPQIPVVRLATLIDNRAWGQFKKGIIYLFENAEIGTGYHEAFEAVWNAYLTDAEQQGLINEFKARPGYQSTDAYKATKAAYPGATENQIIKEMIAEEFRDHVLAIQNEEAPKSLGQKIMKFFKDLYKFIQNWLGLSQEDKDLLDSKISQVFAKITSGEYANAKPVRDLATLPAQYRTLKNTTPEFTKEAIEGLTSSFFMNLYRSENNIDALFLDQDNNKLFVDILNATMFDENSGVIGKLIAPFRGALNEYEESLGYKLNTDQRKEFMHQFAKVDPNIYYKLYLGTNLDAQKELADIFKISLEKYGFSFTEKMDEEDLDQAMSKEATVENPLGILDSINIDPRKMTAANVKLLVASLTDDTYVNDQIKPKVNSLGLLKPVNYGKVLNVLLNELNGTTSVYRDGRLVSSLELMFEKLDKKFKTDGKYKEDYVWIQRLKARLKLEDFAGRKIAEDTLTEDDIRLMVSFEKNFTNNQNIPLKLVMGNDNAIYNVSPVDTVNEKRIRDVWENGIKDTAKPEAQKDGKALVYINNQGKIIFDKESQDFYTVTNAITTQNRIEGLKLMGIEFTYPNLIEESDNDGEKSFSSRLNKAYNSIVYGLTTDKEADQINSFDDLFSRQKVNRSINELLRIEAEMTAEDNILSHQTADGKTQYSITIPSTYANVLNSLRNVNNQADFIRSNPHLGTVDKKGNVTLFAYQGNSRLLGRDGLIFDANGNKRKNINYHLISGIGLQEDGAGKPTDKLQFTDRIVQEIHYIMNGIFYTPINSDKASEFGLETGLMIDFSDVEGSIKNNQTILDLYLLALEDEVDAALFERSAKLPNKIQYYREGVYNLGHFNGILGPKLIKRFKEKVLTGKEKKDDFILSYDVMEAIGNYLENQTKEVLDSLVDIDVFVRTENETGVSYSTKAISSENLSRVGISDPTNISESAVTNIAQFLLVNKQLSVFEQHKMIYGHPALYKDFAKRSNGATSTKEPIVDNEVVLNWMDKNMKRLDRKARAAEQGKQVMNVVSYKDVVTASSYITDNDVYKSLKEADAQAWMMPDMYRDILFLSGKWTKEMEDQWQYEVAYEIANNKQNASKYTEQEKKNAKDYIKGFKSKGVVFPVLKPQFFGYAKNQMTHTVFLKNSVQPKFFRMVEGTQFEKVYNNALGNSIDIVGFESGQKVGNVYDKNGDFVNLYNTDGSITDTLPPVQTLFTKYFGIQVEQPAVFKDLVVRGTQVTKLIMSNFKINGNAINSDVEALLKEYNNIIEQLVLLGKEDLIKELGLTRKSDGTYDVVDLNNLVSVIRKEVEKRNLPDNVLESIAVDPETGKLQTPFDALPIREKIDNIINSIIDSRVISDKMNGKPLVQVSSTGYEFENRKMVYLKDGVYTEISDINNLSKEELATVRPTSSDLKFYRIEDGKIASMEVYLPWFFKGVNPEKLGLEKGRGNIYTVKPGSRIDQRLLNAIGFRIPTQGMNSIENIVIKGFLPREAGDMVVVPSEIVGKAGSDFDIDKLNTYLGNYYFLDGKLEYVDPNLSNDELAELEKKTGIKDLKKKALQNRLIEVMGGLMSQSENYRQLTAPNGSANMKEMAAEINELKEIEDEEKSLTKLSEFIPMAVTRERYVTGKKLVGIAALHTTSHTMFQMAGIELTGTYATRGLKFMHGKNDQAPVKIRLSHNTKPDGGLYLNADKGVDDMYISDMHSEGLTGFVDTANDPFIFYLNLSLDTSSTWFYLQKLGVPLNQLSYFFSQPILEKYFKELSKNKTVLKQATKGKMNSAIVIGKVIEPYLAAIQGKKFVPIVPQMMEKPRMASKILSKAIKGVLAYRNNNPSVDLAQLKKSIELGKSDRIGREEAFVQAGILLDYLEYNKQAGQLTNFIRAIGYDNTSTKNLIENRLQEINWKLSERDMFIANPDAVLDQTFIGEMKLQKEDIFNMYKDFFVSLDPKSLAVFEPLFEKFSDPDFFMLNEDKQDVLNRYQNFYVNYLIHTVPYIKDNVQTTINSKYNLLFGSKSVAHQLKKLQKSTDPKIKNNLFIKELFPLIASETAKTNNIKLFRKRLDAYENNIIIESAANLYDYSQQTGNRDLQKLVEDVAVLAILQSGVQSSPISYTKILPVQIYSGVVSQVINSFRGGSVEVDPRLVWKQFHQNNWKNPDIVPVVDKASKEGGLLSFASDNEYVLHRTIKPGLEADKKKLNELRKAGKWDEVYDYALYEKIPYQDIYRPINMLGDGYRFTEVYNQDRKKSMLLSNKPFDESVFDEQVLAYYDRLATEGEFENIDLPVEEKTQPVSEIKNYGPDGLPSIENNNRNNC